MRKLTKIEWLVFIGGSVTMCLVAAIVIYVAISILNMF